MYNRCTNSIFNFYLPFNCYGFLGLLLATLSDWRNGSYNLLSSVPVDITVYFLQNRKGSPVASGAVKPAVPHLSCGCQSPGQCSGSWRGWAQQAEGSLVFLCWMLSRGSLLVGGGFFALLSTRKNSRPREGNVLGLSSFKILLCLTDHRVTEQPAQDVASVGSVPPRASCGSRPERSRSSSGKRRVLGSSTSPKILMWPLRKYSDIM